MSSLLLYFPLYSALANLSLGGYIGMAGTIWLAPFLSGFTFLAALYLSCTVLLSEEIWYTTLSSCVNLVDYEITWALQIDSLTAVMILVVTSISFLVHVYATSYMEADPHLPRFLACLSLFTFFMLVLVTSDSYFQLFVGWEGVGLCSYFLINFWYTRIQANKAAIQALVVNKVGDFFLVLAVIFLLNASSTTNFNLVFLVAPIWANLECNIGGFYVDFLSLIGFMFLVAAMAKSAQIGFHTWLLSAMEGPTPVSALLHAATMVTAGIFLLLRSSPLLELSISILWVITIVGALTAFFAGTSGLVQHDLKKIIALSTCSQLGYMFYACGLSQYSVSLFHLTNHAFFKALLFLCAGAIIHTLGGEQDLRRMGGLASLMPMTYISMSLASLALIGFPFLSGFYSKDRILELAWGHASVQGQFTFWLTTAAAACTAVYSWRLLYWVFLSDTQGYKLVIQRAHETDERMLWVFRILMLGSLFSGFLLKDAFLGFGSDFLKESIAISAASTTIFFEGEFVPLCIKLLPLLVSCLGAFFALVFYSSSFYTSLVKWQMHSAFGYAIYAFLVKKWLFERLYSYYIALRIYDLGLYLYTHADQGYIEWCGPQGVSKLLDIISIRVAAWFYYPTIIVLSNFLCAAAITIIAVLW